MNDLIVVRIKYFKKHANAFFMPKYWHCVTLSANVSVWETISTTFIHKKTFIPTCVCIISISGIIDFIVA